MKRRLDSVDSKLVELLKANAREATASLARRLGLSRSAVQDRMSRLERDGVIAGYTIRLGKHSEEERLQAIVRFTVDPKYTTEIIRKIGNTVEARSCYSVSGAFDLIVIVDAETALRLNQVLQEFGEIEGVERTTSSIVLGAAFENRS
ncbi:Lrp/AsnC family transcriptional regulator [Pelagibius sp.]|uniref:Lrp/AsnC family transcriptional regulator n=1 Tax=Pelagibius sp. TaxID=1931238 RepID=UPI003BB0DA47